MGTSKQEGCVCSVHVVCQCIVCSGKREIARPQTWRPLTKPLLLAQELSRDSLPFRLLVQA